MAPRLKVVHVISGLTTGGAEMMLYKLVAELRHQGEDSEVVCLGPFGGVAALIEETGVKVHYLHFKKNILFPFLFPLKFFRLVSLLHRVDPDVIQGWMYMGNLVAWAARVFTGILTRRRPRLFWSVHQSLYSLKYEKPVHALLIRISARLSRIPERVVYVSRVAAAQHERRGFSSRNAVVIPIGFDAHIFRPFSSEEKKLARIRAGLDPEAFFAGVIARYDLKKDHLNLVQAVAILRSKNPPSKFMSTRFILTGCNMEDVSNPVRIRVRELGLEEAFIFRGETTGVHAWIPLLDAVVSPSYTEGFPNVIGEAMACGVPCVVTDVGDSAWLLGEGGLVVPPRNPAALAAALEEIIGSKGESGEARQRMGVRGRERILARFSIETVARDYLKLYRGPG